MDTNLIIRLLTNSGFHNIRVDDVYIYFEDPACVIRSFQNFAEYAWIIITLITGVLLFGWAIAYIRGSKTSDIATNLRNLVLIFGTLSAITPIVNLIYNGDLLGAACDEVRVSRIALQTILDARNAKFKSRADFDLYEEFDIYDSGAITTMDIPFETPKASDAESTSSESTESASSVVVNADTRTVVYIDADGTKYKKTGDRAYRNNNPGNIIYGAFARAHGAIASDGRLAIFPNIETGYDAARANLQTSAYQKLTIGGMAERWAPPFENDTDAYQAHLVKQTGLNINTPMRELTDAQLNSLVRAIAMMEGINGKTTRI